jgi:hypothetical protein
MLAGIGNKLEAVVGLELGELCVNCLILFGNSHCFPEVFRYVGFWCDVEAHGVGGLDNSQLMIVVAKSC